MDQLRVVLVWLKEYHFWLLSGLAAVLALAGWYMGTGHLAADYKANRGKIEGAFSSLDQKKNRQFHPNQTVNDKQKEEIEKLLVEVKQTWTDLYERQNEQVLKWPPQLNQQFHDYIATLNFGEDIRRNMREQYTNYIEGRFNDFPKMIDANKLEEGATAGGFGGRGEYGGAGGFGGSRGTSDVEIEDFTVLWDDQVRLKEQLTWPETGSSWQIWATQEDLWVYETLVRAIAATNKAKGSDRRSNAAIRTIFALEVGQEAAKQSRQKGRVTELAVASTGLDEFAGMGGGSDYETGGMGASGDYADGGMSGEGDFGGLGGGDNVNEKAFYFSGRYIDAEGKPIPVGADEEPLDITQFGTEYKRLPVRLYLEMDQRWVSYLVVQLANAPLQIEVQEVRLNPEDVSSGGGGGGYGGGGYGGESARGGGMGMGMGGGGHGGGGHGGGQAGGHGGGGGRVGGGGRGGDFGGGYGGFGSGTDTEVNVFERQPYMKEVVLQGVVYIFNPPDEDKLQLESSGEAGDELASF